MLAKECSGPPLPFSGKKALVVGGTGGIGGAVALALAQRGAEVTVHGGSSRTRLDDTISALRAIGGKGEGFLLPIRGPQAAEDIFSRCSPVDILVCAWGPFKQGSLETLDGEFWQRMSEDNLVFPGIMVSLAIPGMIERNWGRILLFGGTNTDTIRGFTTSTAYSAAKTALGVIAKSAAKTAGCRGVTCNVVCPGLTDTEYVSQDLLRYNREKSPGGRPLSTEQVARAALAIMENPSVNGAVVPVDQGIAL
ncbi:MAG: SDR family NAD(P)-dependent oxidoreductase [Treponema sp.]|nr:SDR family NAD(P)-dependent oxidoreductase [Treponema sp.]